MLVSSVSQLLAAVKGGVLAIVLAPGLYPDIHFLDVIATQQVSISSEIPSRPAVFSGCLHIDNSRDMLFKDLVIDLTSCEDPYWAGRITKVENLSFEHDEVIGQGPTSSAGGLLIVDSSDVQILDSKFHHLGSVALNIGRANRLVISNTEFFDWSKSAVGIGEVHGLLFSNNLIHDAHPLPGVHPDGLQIFTSRTKYASNDIKIIGNKLYEGQGDAFQSIFLGDEERDKPYRDVIIEKNVISGGMWNAIFLKSATGEVKIIDNWAHSSLHVNPTATTDISHPIMTNFTAGILVWLLPDAKFQETGNSAQRYSTRDGRPSPPPPGNSLSNRDAP